MRRLLAAMALSAAALFSTVPAVSAQSLASWNSVSSENRLAALVNAEHRRVCGSSMYRSYLHDNVSRWRSKDMVRRDYFSHTIKGDGRNVFAFLSSYSIRLWYFAGENIGWNTYPDAQSADAVYRQFMNSSGHRALIRNCRYNAFGVGAAKGADGKKMFTVVFTQQPIRRVSTSYTNVRYGPGTQYAVRSRLYYRARMVVFNKGYDRYGRRWYYEHSGAGWGWVPSWQTR